MKVKKKFISTKKCQVMVDVLNPKDFRVKVSSVLNRNVKEFGKQFLFDGREDTCWNSDQGTPQLIQV